MVTTATVGSMTCRYRPISPGTLAPASTTRASVSAGASRMVSGTPIRLLRLARVACTRNRVRSAAASISLVLVFPLVPVTATTGPVTRRRRARASQPERLDRIRHFEELEARAGRSSCPHHRPQRAGGGRLAEVRMPVEAFPGDRHEERAVRQRTGVGGHGGKGLRCGGTGGQAERLPYGGAGPDHARPRNAARTIARSSKWCLVVPTIW